MQTYVTERGRTRRRRVEVDLGAVRARLRAAGVADRAAWQQVRAVLLDAVGESTFELWLARLELLAVDLNGVLVVSAPRELVRWVAGRFGRFLDSAADRAGRRLRVAGELERQAAEVLSPTSAGPSAGVSTGGSGQASCGAAADVSSSGGSGDRPVDGSAYSSAYTDVYNRLKEVS